MGNSQLHCSWVMIYQFRQNLLSGASFLFQKAKFDLERRNELRYQSYHDLPTGLPLSEKTTLSPERDSKSKLLSQQGYARKSRRLSEHEHIYFVGLIRVLQNRHFIRILSTTLGVPWLQRSVLEGQGRLEKWESGIRNPESGIGTGMGRETYIKAGTTFTLI